MCLLFLVFDVWFLASCGGEVENPQGITFSESQGDLGYVHLNISEAKGAIASYRLRLSGEAMETVEQTISAQSAGVEIQGIPAGAHRTIQIQALNEAGRVLREGILEDVTIQSGQTQELAIVLQAVPLVLNLKEDVYLSNQRLYFQLLTDPNHRVGVEGFNDVKTHLSEVVAAENGLLRFYPGILPAGDYAFRILDRDSGKSITFPLHLWEGQDVFSAPLVSATDPSLTRFGQIIATESYSGNLGGEFFPNIAEALWKNQ